MTKAAAEVKPLRKRQRPFADTPEKPKKKIKIEKDIKPFTSEPGQIDVEEVKKLVLAVERDYDKIQLGLRIITA